MFDQDHQLIVSAKAPKVQKGTKMRVCKDALQVHLCPDASENELICVPIHIACDSSDSKTITDTQDTKTTKMSLQVHVS